MKLVAAILLMLLLEGCWGDPGKTLVTPPPHPHISTPSATSTADCAPPVMPVEHKPLTQKQTEDYWGVDAENLLECRIRHRILGNWARKVQAGLAGNN